MDLEETKKIIKNKIEADESAREVRSQIKTYIHEKQNLREGITETFKPLIETSETVKTSIDTRQNKLIKQLQDNQLALTEGFEGDRKAITSGFDKMDEVKKWDLEQLPGYEAIEEPEEKKEEPEEIEETYGEKPSFLISYNDIYRIQGREKKINQDDEELVRIKKGLLDKHLSEELFDKDKYDLKIIDKKRGILKMVEKMGRESKKRTVTFSNSDLDENLMNKKSSDLLYFYSLKFPSYYKDKSLKELQEALKESTKILSNYKDSLKNVAIYDYNIMPGRAIAFPKNGEKAREHSKKEIEEHNIMENYKYNLNRLREIKEKTGQGIIHFNNPQQLVNRLELLAGSIFAGNNGVKQEFSQIAHLLHQLKVISKKTLNDLLKKYILFK